MRVGREADRREGDGEGTKKVFHGDRVWSVGPAGAGGIDLREPVDCWHLRGGGVPGRIPMKDFFRYRNCHQGRLIAGIARARETAGSSARSRSGPRRKKR